MLIPGNEQDEPYSLVYCTEFRVRDNHIYTTIAIIKKKNSIHNKITIIFLNEKEKKSFVMNYLNCRNRMSFSRLL